MLKLWCFSSHVSHAGAFCHCEVSGSGNPAGMLQPFEVNGTTQTSPCLKSHQKKKKPPTEMLSPLHLLKESPCGAQSQASHALTAFYPAFCPS